MERLLLALLDLLSKTVRRAENATPEEINELEEILREQEEEVVEGKDSVQADSKFHHLLAKMARNRVLERLLLALLDLLSKTREKYLQTEERKQKSLQGHREVLVAIRNGNGAAARQAMRRHLENVEGILLKKKKGGVQNHRFQGERSHP